jgi:hypothetical protein
LHTSLGGTKVFARGGRAGTGAAGLFNAERTTVDNLALKTVLSSIGLIGRDHLDEAEAARLLAVRVAHNLTLLNLAVLFKHARHLGLGQAGVDAGHEEVRSGVNCTVIIDVAGTRAAVVLGSVNERLLG